MSALAVAVLLATAVSFPATDGRSLSAQWTGATGKAPAPVVIVAAPADSRKDWQEIGERLASEGVSTLVLRLRTLPADADLTPVTYDLAGAFRWVRARKDVDERRILVAGDGVEGLTGLAAAAADPEVAAVALVSPRLAPDRMDDESAISDLGKRPLFVAVARGDRPAAKASLVLEGSAKGRKEIHIAEGKRAGAELLAKDPETWTAFRAWVRQHGGLEARPAAHDAAPAPTRAPAP